MAPRQTTQGRALKLPEGNLYFFDVVPDTSHTEGIARDKATTAPSLDGGAANPKPTGYFNSIDQDFVDMSMHGLEIDPTLPKRSFFEESFLARSESPSS